MVKEKITSIEHLDMETTHLPIKPRSTMTRYMALLFAIACGWQLQTYTLHNRY